MGTKVTEMQEASQVKDGDLLMIVQDGANKKVDVNKFVRKGDSVDNANTLDGYTADDFMKVDDTSRNSDRLGGIDANEYPTRDELPSLISKVADPTWCRPIMWVGIITDDMANIYHYHECDGAALDKDQYKELFDVIGYQFTRDNQGNEVVGQMFRLPDLRGRFPLGATSASNPIKTMDLPQGLYRGKDFDSNGQLMIPAVLGDKGGSMTVTQDSIMQMAYHDHSVKPASVAVIRADGSHSGSGSGYPESKSETLTVNGKGQNDNAQASYPTKGSQYNYGMPAMPPYVSLRYIMKIKP